MKSVVIKILLSIFVIFNLCSCQKEQNTDVDLLDKIKTENHFVVGINENSRPFAYYDANGEFTGFDVELIKEVSKLIFGTSSVIEFKPVSPSDRILKLNSNEVDVVISTMTITKERLQVIDFSNSYFMSGQAIMVQKDSNIRSGKDLNGKVIGIVLGTTAANSIKFIAPKSTIKGFKNYKEAFKQLKKNNIDAISTDDVILQGLISNNKNYKILPDRYSKEYYGIAFRKDKNSQKLKDEVNNALNLLEKSGELVRLEKKYEINYKR